MIATWTNPVEDTTAHAAKLAHYCAMTMPPVVLLSFVILSYGRLVLGIYGEDGATWRH